MLKLTYCDYPNKNIEHLDLRFTKNWDMDNATFTEFLQ